VDSLRINKQTSNLKFVRAMLASTEMELHDIGPDRPRDRSADRGAVAKAREVNDGLRALFLPPHGRPLRIIAEAIRAKGHKLSHEGVANVLRTAGELFLDDRRRVR
jgi:hypothetical protein